MPYAATAVALVVALIAATGCHHEETHTPELRDFSGPANALSDLDHKVSWATADLKEWADTRVTFKYATNQASDLVGPLGVELEPTCTGEQVLACSVEIPSFLTTGGPVFAVGDTVFYQWFIEYSDPDGDPAGVAATIVRSFEVVAAEVCTENAQCSPACTEASVCATPRVCGLARLYGDPTGEQLQASYCYAPVCPVGANGRLCSGHGTCNVATRACACDADYRNADCGRVCQRCYGAAGNNCGDAENDFGYCEFTDGFSLPAGTTMRQACADPDIDVPNVTCQISVGSWTHDVCCIAEGEFMTCSVGSILAPDNVCQSEGNLALGEITQSWVPGTTSRVWTRSVDPCIEICGEHGPAAPPIIHSQMCAPSGATLSCETSGAAGFFCCSGSATNSGGGICTCD